MRYQENNPEAGFPKESPPPLVVILGATAVGKTEIAIQLAERFCGEIVSADSRLFYRGMDIGTAKPSASERRHIPHHLIDVTDPDQVWSLALFQQEAHAIITEIRNRDRLPFLVGGTGQYIRAVTQHWQIPSVEPDPRLRVALNAWTSQIGGEALHNRLAVLDPLAAKAIDPRNVRRTVRALEVIFSSGERFSAQRRRGDSPYRLLQIGLTRPRPELYTRIDERIDRMIDSGFVAEVQALLARGYSPELPSLSAIGYREIITYLQGSCTLEEAVFQIRRSTRVFVRRQANWFKSADPQILWFQVGEGTVAEIEAVILNFLSDHCDSHC
jgi:tRNA dimethylallyltransferase